MATHLFNLAAICSAVAFTLVVLSVCLGGHVAPRTQFLSPSSHFHLTLTGCGSEGGDPRIVFFNDPTYGPFAGIILTVAGDPNQPKITAFGDTAGIYYRRFRWPNGQTLWTLAVSLWYPLFATLPLPALWLGQRIDRARRASHAAGGFDVLAAGAPSANGESASRAARPRLDELN